MAAAAGAQHLGAVLFEGNVASDRRNFVAHHVGGAEAREILSDGNLRYALLRGGEQEPAYKSDPESLGNVAIEGAPCAQKNHRVGDELAAGASDSRGLGEIFTYTPHQGAENAPAI